MLKVCRAPGPTACVNLLQKVCLKGCMEKGGKKIHDCMDLGSLEPAAIPLKFERCQCQAVRMFSPCQFHVSIGTLESDLL